jgi:hypothetical protein
VIYSAEEEEAILAAESALYLSNLPTWINLKRNLDLSIELPEHIAF